MKKKKKILFIINPISGIGKQRKIEKAIPLYLDKTKFEHEIRYTEKVNHAKEISTQAKQEGFDIIVAVGGDGTLGEVASGILFSDTAMAVIPAGSGNGMARELGIPRNNIRKAFDLINRCHIETIDTALLNGNTFVSTAGSGFDAHVANMFSVGEKRGFFRYAAIVAREFLRYPSRNYEVYVNGETKKYFAWAFIFCNSKQFGNGAVVSPKSNVQDGLLNITVVKDFPKIFTAILVLRMFFNNLDKSKYTETFTCKKIKVIREKNNAIHLDGSPFKTTKDIEAEIVPASLKVVVAGNF